LHNFDRFPLDICQSNRWLANSVSTPTRGRNSLERAPTSLSNNEEHSEPREKKEANYSDEANIKLPRFTWLGWRTPEKEFVDVATPRSLTVWRAIGHSVEKATNCKQEEYTGEDIFHGGPP
jgi:hypothetical protein